MPPTYKYCTLGGIVCTICCYPVKPTNVRGIMKHESHDVHASDKNTNETRHRIVKEYNEYVDIVARQSSSNENSFKTYLDKRQLYWYCSNSKCNVLVQNRRSHKSGTHWSYCNNKRHGYGSLYWTKKEPVILDDNFTIHDVENNNRIGIHSDITSAITRYQQQQQEPEQQQQQQSVRTFQQLLNEQEQCFTANEETLILDAIDQSKNPTLWVQRCGWEVYLKNYDGVNIFQMTQKTEECMVFESEMEKSILNAISHVKQTYPLSHHIYFEIERRDDNNNTYPTKPYRIKPEKTNLRYIGYFKAILRTIIKVDNYHSTFIDDSGQPKLFPLISMSNNTREIVSNIKRNPSDTTIYIEFIMSLLYDEYIDVRCYVHLPSCQ